MRQALSSQTGVTGVYADGSAPLILGFGFMGWEYQYEHNLHYLTQAAADHDRTLQCRWFQGILTRIR